MARPAKITDLKGRFIDAYIKTGGDTAAAVRIAGYQGNDNTLRVAAQKLMKDPLVLEALMKSAEGQPEVWDKTSLQKWWTHIVKGGLVVLYTREGTPYLGPAPIAERRHFSELLGKSQAAFVEVKRHEHKGRVRIVSVPDNGRGALVPEQEEKKPLPS